MPKKIDGMAVRFEPAERAAIERIADEEERGLSTVIRRIVRDWLEQHGHLPKKDLPKRARG